jgi:misacylated tRNA(Ala) deacylase
MENPLYLSDSYARSCSARVLSASDGKFVALEPQLFAPRGGGLVSDTGKIAKGADTYNVIGVTKKDGAILHELAPAAGSAEAQAASGAIQLSPGDEVECSLDWERRHRLMRSHTAGHILSAIMYKSGGIMITGNAIDVDKSRFDFSMENFDRDAFQKLIDEANHQIARGLEVTTRTLPREDALKLPGMVKLAGVLPPEVTELRIVKIGDVDEQADGGVHVRNTSEIGKIVFLSAENKGKSNRRVYFSLSP